MNFTVLTGFCIIGIIAVSSAGCLGTGNAEKQVPPVSPHETPVQVGHIVVNEQQDGATTSLNVTNTITLRLKENGTTGFLWNLTTTPGLLVTNDTFVSSDPTGTRSGAGGVRLWEITVKQPGEQKIKGVYKRAWENATGNEAMFTMTIIAGPA